RAWAGGRLAGVRVNPWHRPVGRFGLHFGFAVAELRQIAQRNVVERVTGRAGLLVDLVTALELLQVPFTESPVVREVHVLGMFVELMLGGFLDQVALPDHRCGAPAEGPHHREGEGESYEYAD